MHHLYEVLEQANLIYTHRKWLLGAGVSLTEKGQKGTFWDTNVIFFIIMMVTQVYGFVKTVQIVKTDVYSVETGLQPS